MNRYVDLLEHSYAMTKAMGECPPDSRVEFLCEQVFDITTYDGQMSEIFGRKALEVCKAINDRETFKYIENAADHVWFLMMCNLPFFAKRVSWGASIRGAFWDCYPSKVFVVQSYGLWENDDQILRVEFTEQEWGDFVKAMLEFSAKDEE